MDNRQADAALREYVARRPEAGIDIRHALVVGPLVSQGADLPVVDDQIVEMRQARPDDAGEALRLDHDQFEIGGEAGGLGVFENGHPAIRIALPGRVQSSMNAGKAEMEDAPAGPGEVP